MSRRVAVYARVSTHEQADGLSIDNQLAACHAHAARQGWQVAGIWQDVESGRNDDRAGYLAMLADKGWNTILVWRCDRLGRDAAELFRVARMLRKTDRKLLSVTENVDEPFIMGLNFLLAERESWLIGERVRPINQRQTREGRHVSRPPMPYRMVDKRLVVDDDELSRYLELVDLVEAGTAVRAVCVLWNSRGWRTRQGAAFQVSHLVRVLRNPLHAGYVRRRGVEGLIEGQHTAVIEQARWRALQAHLDDVARSLSFLRPNGTGPGKPTEWLLTGFLRCGCGGSMTHQRRGFTRFTYDYYLCYRYRQVRACPIRRAVRCDVAHEAVERFLAPIIAADPRQHVRQAHARLTVAESRDTATERQRARLTADAARARQRLTTAADRLVDGTWTLDEYQTHRARYQADLTTAESALAALPTVTPTPTLADLEAQAALLAPLGEVWRDAGQTDNGEGLAHRRALLRTIGLTVTRQPDGLHLAAHPALVPFLPPLVVPAGRE